MNTQNEKSVDIIAEMRELSKSVNFRCKPLPYTMYGKLIDVYFAELADRLEAAIKREKAAIEAEALAAGGIVEAERYKPGNAAADASALEKRLHYLTGETELVKDEIITLCDVMNAALAAAPRNCDRFATVKDAAIAFARERQDAPHPCPDFTFSAWLFEPATEKEGGAK